jgi:putative ABC transport system permease protein
MYFPTFILKNLTRRPVRTVLTVLGLSVAVGSMIALLGISRKFEATVLDTFDRRGVDLVVIESGKPVQTDSEIDEAVLARVKALDKVEMVDATLLELTDVSRASRSNVIPAMVQGWPAENFARNDLEILDGVLLTPALGGQRPPKAMVGERLAQSLKVGVGDRIVIRDEEAEVAGTFKSFNGVETASVLLLLPDYQKIARREGKITGFSLRVRKGADPDGDVREVRQAILDMKDEQGRSMRLSAEPPREYAQNASHLRLTRGMAWVVSVIAIVIGVISMLNTMVMSVLERTQEIGILRAVGWTRGRVVRMVLGEAVVLGLASAAVGTAGAVAATYVLARMPRASGFIEGGVSWPVVAQGVAITALIALAGGFYPAIRAARLMPTEAIRHD